jgi:CDP-4-dehydro-6-deoxyglucose reductase, E1
MTNSSSLRISYASAVHDDLEKQRVIKVLDEHRTIIGREIEEFEKRVSEAFGYKYGIMVNSGSSANLVALELLNLPEGSEVITPLLTFSTTVAPLIQKKLVPVFIDVEEGKYNINVDHIERAITSKTKLLMIPLLIGNVSDMERLTKIAKKHKLNLIIDSCDTFAATFNGKPVGAFGDITTTSFYGSHIITAGGGGGMLMVNNKKWKDRAKVLRGWGRSSSNFGDTEDITKRFKAKIGNLQYDAKFIFDEIGYNFLPLEMGAAFGNAQLDKVAKFKKTRENNFQTLYKFFKKYSDYFILPVQDLRVKTQWLAFPLTIKKTSPFSRLALASYLEKNNIQTRPVFTGNILKQPGFKNIPHKGSENKFPITNIVMEHSILVGCHHGLTQEHMLKMQEVFSSFLQKYK